MGWELEFVKKAERDYLGNIDWEVKENANENVSFANFMSYILDKLLKNKEILADVFGQDAAEAHINGDIHIHKLPFSLYIPYCSGWNFGKILRMGLITPSVISKPAKHLDSAINHFINFAYLVCQEFSGAVAINAADLYLGAFIRHDNADYKKVKQALQTMLFELNYPTRTGYQSPFTNVMLLLDTVEPFLQEDAIVSGQPVGKLGDYLDEAMIVVKALCELYREGDGNGNPFTFPIPTIILNGRFDWNETKWGDVTYEIFKTLATRGTFYILNGYAIDVNQLFAFCCRLNINYVKAYNFALANGDGYKHVARGVWGIPDGTGSIGVITINLPRLAFLSRGDLDVFFELLREQMELGRKILSIMRERYEKHLRLGLMPVTRKYINGYHTFYSTFGVVGLPEAAANFIDPNLWRDWTKRDINEAVKFMKNAIAFMREVCEEFEEEDCIMYNVEEVPAESCGYRLAMKDYELYRQYVEAGEFFIPFYDGVPFYSNSIIPYYIDIPIYERAKLEGEVQQEFTGGVMMHLFLSEAPEPEALKKLVEKICKNTKVVYFSITPAITVCYDCRDSFVGIYEKCPKCGSQKIEIWSRIVGYYRPLSRWNIGRKAEFKTRVHYKVTI